MNFCLFIPQPLSITVKQRYPSNIDKFISTIPFTLENFTALLTKLIKIYYILFLQLYISSQSSFRLIFSYIFIFFLSAFNWQSSKINFIYPTILNRVFIKIMQFLYNLLKSRKSLSKKRSNSQKIIILRANPYIISKFFTKSISLILDIQVEK